MTNQRALRDLSRLILTDEGTEFLHALADLVEAYDAHATATEEFLAAPVDDRAKAEKLARADQTVSDAGREVARIAKAIGIRVET